MNREIKYIVIHCSGASNTQTVESIQRYWRETLGWKNPGYHRIIDTKGNITELEDFNKVTNGVAGFNSNSIHICYIGGQFEDTRTEEQKVSILDCIYHAIMYIDEDKRKDVIIQGHRDFPNVKKDCPNFDAKKEYEWITA